MAGKLWKIEKWEEKAKKAGYRLAALRTLCELDSNRPLERFVRQKYQTTPEKWLRDLQWAGVNELLAKGWQNKAIDDKVKFAGASHLCHEFRKRFGKSPQAVAKILRKESKRRH